MWLLAASPQTLSAAALILAAIAALPGTLAFLASRRDAENRRIVGEGANAVSGFDKLTSQLSKDNDALRHRVAELETHVETLENKVNDLEQENARLRAGR